MEKFTPAEPLTQTAMQTMRYKINVPGDADPPAFKPRLVEMRDLQQQRVMAMVAQADLPTIVEGK